MYFLRIFAAVKKGGEFEREEIEYISHFSSRKYFEDATASDFILMRAFILGCSIPSANRRDTHGNGLPTVGKGRRVTVLGRARQSIWAHGVFPKRPWSSQHHERTRQWSPRL